MAVLTREEAVRRLVVAADASERGVLVALAKRLRPAVGMVKLGLEAFVACGPELVREVRGLGVPVFLDLKLHDIPNTVERAAASAARLGVQMLTVHAGGGEAMLRAAVAGAAAGAPAGSPPPVVLAVTVLTSLDDETLATLGLPGTAGERVRAWAALAHRAGCGGIVCSPHEVAAMRAAFGPDFVLLSPGIRPAGGAAGDQKRVATPRAAVEAGATYVVVGRPITGAPDPLAAAEAILTEMCGHPVAAGQ
ncbi:MAG TPA: orotidine-5'-phosphate decarboxylase [Thermoanaerobaculaceae bacterium]|nr:orotidine-5'-phosphate decarboxylase [Thermoanaerobaculaceae bacterium]HRS15866.1 orotidine-5'-phosphate decarboxylase [Thermoanaerobaculaceae bacterium]